MVKVSVYDNAARRLLWSGGVGDDNVSEDGKVRIGRKSLTLNGREYRIVNHAAFASGDFGLWVA